jgi:hypothetical protein
MGRRSAASGDPIPLSRYRLRRPWMCNSAAGVNPVSSNPDQRNALRSKVIDNVPNGRGVVAFTQINMLPIGSCKATSQRPIVEIGGRSQAQVKWIGAIRRRGRKQKCVRVHNRRKKIGPVIGDFRLQEGHLGQRVEKVPIVDVGCLYDGQGTNRRGAVFMVQTQKIQSPQHVCVDSLGRPVVKALLVSSLPTVRASMRSTETGVPQAASTRHSPNRAPILRPYRITCRPDLPVRATSPAVSLTPERRSEPGSFMDDRRYAGYRHPG